MEHGDALSILLYPSDEFGAQELPSEQIAPYVSKTFGLPVDQPGGSVLLAAKIKTNGENADPVWKALKEAFPGDVRWNFAAIFVVDGSGVPRGRFSSKQMGAVYEAVTALL